MVFIDTSLLEDRVHEGTPIDEDVCLISLTEYPALPEYRLGRWNHNVFKYA